MAIASVVIILAGLKLARDLLVPVLLGMMVAATSSPVVTYLLRKRLPPIFVAVVALTLDIVVLGILGVLFATAAGDVSAFLPRHAASITNADASFGGWLAHHGIHDVPHPLAPLLRGERVGQTIAGAADTFATVASGIAVVLLVAFFTLCEVTILGDKLRAFVSNAEAHFARLDRIIHEIQRYLVVKILVSLTAGVLAFIVLKALHVELALLLACVLFLLHFLPAIGVPIAMIPAVGVALLSRGVGTAIAVAISYEVIAILCGNILEPRMLGRTIGLSPLTVLLSMLFWGWMWGPLGAILAVPLTAVVKIVLENAKGFEWWARLLETSPDLGKKHPFLQPPTYVIGEKHGPKPHAS
jgi:predicted PurR-regulated permease PerM